MVHHQCLENVEADLAGDNIAEYNETTFLETSFEIIGLLTNESCAHGKSYFLLVNWTGTS